MTIEEYIVDYWYSKVSDAHPLLIIYDAEKRYQKLLPLAEKKGFKVIDTTEQALARFLEAREYWRNHLVRNNNGARMLVYRTVHIPTSNSDKQAEPYYAMSLIGAEFPIGAKDSYQTLCHQFMPDHVKEIDKLFEEGHTDFVYINSIGSGNNYPVLEQLTGGKSMIEITTGFLMLRRVSANDWQEEWQRFCQQYYPNLNTSDADLKTMQNRLWQYLLFSEFVYDLPAKTRLPERLKSIPIAPNEESRIRTIDDVCNKLRSDMEFRDDYVEHAEKTAKDLGLEDAFAKATDLGEIVTFAFENIVEYSRYIQLINSGNYAEATQLLDKNRKGVWFSANKRVEMFWKLATELNTLIHYAIVEGLGDHSSLDAMIDHYAKSGYHIDQAFRNFMMLEQRVDFVSPFIKELKQIAISTYKDITQKMVIEYQSVFAAGIKNVSIDRNNQVFNHYVLPELKNKKRVAMVMADAFRYEMGVQLSDQLKQNNDYQVECKPSLAQLPTYTPNGMAALLPDADTQLALKTIVGKLEPIIDGKKISLPAERIAYIQSSVSYKVQDMLLSELEAEKVDKDTRLLVIRDTIIDNLGEHGSIQGLDSMNSTLRKYSKAVMLCRAAGIDEVLIFADHGFMIQPDAPVSETIDKPKGNEIVLNLRRCMAGNLDSAANTLAFSPEQLGIRSDAPQFVFAHNFCTFSKGHNYFHEGLSLEENIVPIVSVQLAKKQESKPYQLDISYKNGDTIRILHPKLSFTINFPNELFGDDLHLHVTIKDQNGNKVGSVLGSSYYDEATEVLNIPAGTTSFNQNIELEEGISGEITVTVTDAATEVMVATQQIKTDLQF